MPDKNAGMLREHVIGDSISSGKYVMAAVGMGFLGALLGFIPLVGILIGLIAIVVAWKWLKTGISKVAGYVLGASAIAAGIASSLWGSAAQANATSANFKAQTGVWKLFGYAMVPLDYANQYIFNKSAGTTWNAVRGVSFTTSSTPANTGATGAGTPTCPGCGAV